MTMHNIPPIDTGDFWDKVYVTIGIIAGLIAAALFVGGIIWVCHEFVAGIAWVCKSFGAWVIDVIKVIKS